MGLFNFWKKSKEATNKMQYRKKQLQSMKALVENMQDSLMAMKLHEDSRIAYTVIRLLLCSISRNGLEKTLEDMRDACPKQLSEKENEPEAYASLIECVKKINEEIES